MYTSHDRFRGASIALLLLFWMHQGSFASPPATSSSPQQNSSSDSILTSSNLPIIVIDTHGQMIRDEPKIDAEMGIIDNGSGSRNHPGDPFNNYHGKIGIELRGSSSQNFPKKPFAIETRDSLGEDLDVSLLGLPPESDWVLYAPYNDKSLIRDVMVYQLARGMGRYASRSRYCELVLNGDYVGVYVLLEKIKRDKNRVNISKMSQADTSGDALTGGYIIKIDKREGSNVDGWYSGFPPFIGTSYRIFYQFHYPDQEDLVEAQRGYITRNVRDFEIAMYLSSSADSAQAYTRLLDVGSFVDGILLNELSKNVDAYRLSTFMYRDRDSKGGTFVMGPLWDYNLGFGNCDYYDASVTEGFQLSYVTAVPSSLGAEPYHVAFWWRKLFDDPGFQRRLKERWSELRKDQCSLTKIEGMVDSLTALLGEAQQRNFRRWPILGAYVWPNAFVGKTYREEIDYLKAWIESRLGWLDIALRSTVTEMPEQASTPAPGICLLQNFPNPFNGISEIGFRISKSSEVKLQIFDMLGRVVVTLVDELKTPGTYTVPFDAGRLASGTYLYRLKAGSFSQTRKMFLLR